MKLNEWMAGLLLALSWLWAAAPLAPTNFTSIDSINLRFVLVALLALSAPAKKSQLLVFLSLIIEMEGNGLLGRKTFNCGAQRVEPPTHSLQQKRMACWGPYGGSSSSSKMIGAPGFFNNQWNNFLYSCFNFSYIWVWTIIYISFIIIFTSQP